LQEKQSLSLESVGLYNTGRVYHNLSVPGLVKKATYRGEGTLSSSGALCVRTGRYTGRSPQDKFIVESPQVSGEIWWGPVNRPISPEKFEQLHRRLCAYLQGRELFVFDGFVGSEMNYRYPIRFINELAWQNMFARQLFLRPGPQEQESFKPYFTVICAPGFQADPTVDGTHSEAFVILDFEKRMILIGGTHYAGEIKKSIFSVMNYLLPRRGVLSMHCSANVGKEGDVTLFFGLSGTGKTSLSADPDRFLIGDDEHGWSEHGIFNLEGGCYAKCIDLSREREPQIWNAIKFGAVVENVVAHPATGELDFGDKTITENTRAGYPVDFIPDAVVPGVAGHPNVIIFLTADAFGVLPPVSRLNSDQAMYHFLSGYTSKLAGTERGVTTPVATFSTCFGAPFLPLPPTVYARLLKEKIDRRGADVYLVNTGWIGGPYGVGERVDILYTRRMVRAAITGKLTSASYKKDPVFNLMVPRECPGVPKEILWPEDTWKDKEAFQKQAQVLAERFVHNFSVFADIQGDLAAAGPLLNESFIRSQQGD